MVTGKDPTLGGGHTMQCIDDAPQKCALETCMILFFTNVTPINLFFK